MEDIDIKEIDSFNNQLIEKIKHLEKKNMGESAAINEWVIPVIIRYGKILLVREKENNRIIGICELLKKWEDINTAFIYSFYIDSEFRGLGIGRKLMGRTIKVLEQENLKKIELTVDPENKVAMKLYESYGFIKKELRRSEYGAGVNRYLMTLKII